VSCSASGDFLVDAAGGAVLTSGGNGSPAMWEHRLVATAIPLLLAERGDLVLHASGVVDGDGRGVLFCGPTGRGKSTLVAALAEHGHPVIGEDGIALTFEAERILTWPGPSGIRLKGSGDPFRSPVETAGPVPLAAVVVLGPRGGQTPRCERVGRAAALAGLGPNAIYAGPARLARAFKHMARLAERVPVYRAHVPDDLGALPEAAATLLAEVLS
jgi:hypothetical protein